MQTFYWHDYETWGINPAEDWPCQFAGVRTDWDLNPIGEPLNIQCIPPEDCLPALQAGLVTGLSPQQVKRDGISEREFFSRIHAELARSSTCGVGYNSIRFDDEVTRYGLYRNFYDPYAREWRSGCSRWDIIDLVRLCYALRPDGIEWPMSESEQGHRQPQLKLELICELNGIEHVAAHDALSDVYATIALARKIKSLQPKMFDFALSQRNKQEVIKSLALGTQAMRLHISSKFGAVNANASMILPLVADPRNKNEIHCIDLRYSPKPLLELSAEELAELRFTRIEDLPAGIERIPLKSIHLNRSPIVLSEKMVDDAVAERCGLDMERCARHREMLLGDPSLAEKVIEMSALSEFKTSSQYAEGQLYEGFITAKDRAVCARIPSMDGSALAKETFFFEDERLSNLLFRYRARNFPETLNSQELEEWQGFVRGRVQGDRADYIQEQMQLAEALLKKTDESDDQHAVAQSYSEYYAGVYKRFG